MDNQWTTLDYISCEEHVDIVQVCLAIHDGNVKYTNVRLFELQGWSSVRLLSAV